MRTIPNSLQDLIKEFSKLPGIGKKTAERLSIYILKTNVDNVNSFIHALNHVKENIKICDVCHAFVDDSCEICNDSKRDKIASAAAIPDAKANPNLAPSKSAIQVSYADLVGFLVLEYS